MTRQSHPIPEYILISLAIIALLSTCVHKRGTPPAEQQHLQDLQEELAPAADETNRWGL